MLDEPVRALRNASDRSKWYTMENEFECNSTRIVSMDSSNRRIDVRLSAIDAIHLQMLIEPFRMLSLYCLRGSVPAEVANIYQSIDESPCT